jgi:hypothetical protein
MRPGSHLKLLLYVTVPLFVYDLTYCGFYLGYGIRFILEYGYLTVYYVLPWLILPPTGWWVDRGSKQEIKKCPLQSSKLSY